MSTNSESTPQLLYRAEEVAVILGVGRTRVFALIKSGELRSVLIGTSRRVTYDALVEYVRKLDAAA
ncbi:MAG TPA: helix-turn-helix domain-containing protein [Pseudonocardia sp.]|jgi:excisionase family DNA binding protein|nr:helix-turn-helix domain-containing protein [Pseudonocardia sp.]